ncbi:MAG: FmdB family transcriptional regulator [Streptosporangiales bacterium]|nr:FmdB family transcriptional regulator [Streptosporangiales bacterium]
MPTYAYACADCTEQLEVVQRITDDALTQCPTCGGGLRKVFQPVGVVFKGSGFYRNDSRSTTKTNGSSKNSGDKDSGKTSSNESSSSSGSNESSGSSSSSSSSSDSSSSSTSSTTSTSKAAAS